MTAVKLTLAAVLLAAFGLVTAAPANAHPGRYCGHSSTSHWGVYLWVPWKHRISFVRSWTDAPHLGGRHMHEVRYDDGYTIRRGFHSC